MKLLVSVVLLCSLKAFSQEKEAFLYSAKAKDSIRTSQIEKSLNSKSDTLSILIPRNTIKLNEVKIRPNSQINAYSLGIIPKPVKTPTQYERQLLTAGDFKPIHLLGLLGGSLQVDPIINAISGRTKRLKKYVQIEKQQKYQEYLTENFQEYFAEALKIDSEFIGSFVIHLCEDKKVMNLIATKSFEELEFLMAEKWFDFKSNQIGKAIPAEMLQKD